MEIAHHVKIDPVYRVVESEVVADPAYLQPGGVALQIASVGVVGIPFCHHAYCGVCAKIGKFKTAFCPAVLIFMTITEAES